MQSNSRIPGFYKLSPEDQIRKIKEFSGLSEIDLELLNQFGYLSGTPYLKKRTGKREKIF